MIVPIIASEPTTMATQSVMLAAWMAASASVMAGTLSGARA